MPIQNGTGRLDEAARCSDLDDSPGSVERGCQQADRLDDIEGRAGHVVRAKRLVAEVNAQTREQPMVEHALIRKGSPCPLIGSENRKRRRIELVFEFRAP